MEEGRSVDPADMVGESAVGSMMLDLLDYLLFPFHCRCSAFLFASDVVSCSSHNKFVIGIMPRHVDVYSRKIKTDRVLKH
jgi:hypothetical protein